MGQLCALCADRFVGGILPAEPLRGNGSSSLNFAVQVVWVWICGFRLLRATRSRMDNTYTDDRSYLLQPTHTLLILIGVTAVVSTLLNILGRELFDGSWLVYIPAVLMSVLLFSLGYVAAHTQLPQETIAPEEAHEEDRATTEETDALIHKIATVLREDESDYSGPCQRSRQ